MGIDDFIEDELTSDPAAIAEYYLGEMNAHVDLPFEIKHDGTGLTVRNFVLADGVICARCDRDDVRECSVDLSQLVWPEIRPTGFEWIRSYLAWRRTQSPQS